MRNRVGKWNGETYGMASTHHTISDDIMLHIFLSPMHPIHFNQSALPQMQAPTIKYEYMSIHSHPYAHTIDGSAQQ